VKRLPFFLPIAALFSVMAAPPVLAQEPESKPTVAVYVSGDIPDYQKEFIGTYLLYALINSGADANDETSAAFLAAVGDSQSKRKKPLNDSLICVLSRKFDIRYVCAAAVTQAPDSAVTLSARIISAKTGKSRYNSEITLQLKTMEDLEQICAMTVERMFDGRNIFGGQTAPPEVAAQPAYAAANAAADSVAKATAVAVESAETAAHRGTAAVSAEIVHADADADDTVAVKPPSMRMKYVAVVETEIDAQSGASAELTSADARLVTAELRREAVKNLPRGRYNVMTSETVYAQGSAVLDKCADENCVIILGSAIGADFIVRGIISKMQTKFTLTVEIYETEDGNLVASSDPIRSESLEGMLEQTAVVCAEMYKSFVAAHAPPPEPAAPPPAPTVAVQEPDTPLWKLHKMGIDISVGAGGVISGGFGGGVEWNDGERVTMPYTASGVCLFLDAAYAELFLVYQAGNGKWESPNVPDPQRPDLPAMTRSCINAGFFVKYPFNRYSRVKLFPLIGLDYEASISGQVKYENGDNEYALDGANGRPNANSLSSLWLKAGGGIDFAMGKTLYLRSEILYGARAANAFEHYCADKKTGGDAYAKFGQGVTFKAGVGIRL